MLRLLFPHLYLCDPGFSLLHLHIVVLTRQTDLPQSLVSALQIMGQFPIWVAECDALI